MSVPRRHGTSGGVHAALAGRAHRVLGVTRRNKTGSARVRTHVPRGHAPIAPERTAQSLTDLWDRHGSSAYSLACALLGDDAAASLAVTRAMGDLAHSPDDASAEDAQRLLARRVYARCQGLAGDTPRTLLLPPMMVWLGELAQLQRACLALCVFGGHTHREAADLLGAPALTVAALLTSGLQELGRLSAGGTATTG